MNKSEKVIEGNEAIAKFMGGDDYVRWCTDLDYPKKGKYHTSWDWLLPAWVKFWDLANVMAYNNPSLYERLRNIRVIFMACIDLGDISNASRILSEGIEWYNKQTK
jgi:hypothetical protein